MGDTCLNRVGLDLQMFGNGTFGLIAYHSPSFMPQSLRQLLTLLTVLKRYLLIKKLRSMLKIERDERNYIYV